MNRFREDALTQLLNDLELKEQVGFHPDQCDKVKAALRKVVSTATEIPDGGMLNPPIWKDLQRFADIYEKWNSHEGANPEFIKRRRLELQKLRKQRHRVARRVRKNTHILSENLDLQLVTAMYEALADLVRAIPESFSSLWEAIKRFFGLP